MIDNATVQAVITELQNNYTNINLVDKLPNNFHDVCYCNHEKYVTFMYKNKEFFVGFYISYGKSTSYNIYTKRGKRVGYGLSTYYLDKYINRLNKKPSSVTAKVLFKDISEKLDSLGYKDHKRVPNGYRLCTTMYNINWYLQNTKFSVELTYGDYSISNMVIAEYDIGNPNFNYLDIVEKSAKKLFNPTKILIERYNA